MIVNGSGLSQSHPSIERMEKQRRQFATLHGRVRTTVERRQKLLEESDKSGLSAPKFATLTTLKYQTLAGWLQQHKRLQAPKEAAVC
jgi:hypothetical protein